MKEALVIAQKIKEKNNGHPWATGEVARACGTSAKGNTFFYLSAAARDYGFTTGTRYKPQIELAQLGREIVYAPDPATERAKKIEAFFNIPKFKEVYDYYEGSTKLPESPYLENTLDDQFHIPRDQHDDFIRLFKANCAYLGIENGLNEVGEQGSEQRTDSHLSVRVIGPQDEFEWNAFVIMPFSEKDTPARSSGFFNEVLKSLITPAGHKAGFRVETARKEGSDLIQHTIIKQLLEADLVIADLTDHNPNVLFELGIRLAKEKPVALIRASGTAAIFDVDNLMRVFSYDPNLWPTTIAADLDKMTAHIKGAWEGRATSPSYMKILTTGQAELG